MSSTPTLSEFDPRPIPFQSRVIYDMAKKFDYSLGVHEVLLSGSVGSSKSLLAAHLGVLHCMKWDQARLCLARKAMPDLKDTIFRKILDHIEGPLTEGEDYSVNKTKAYIRFRNGSEIISRSWRDKKFKKFRSLDLSAAIVEELTENDDDDKKAIVELRLRLGRLPHVKENWIIYCTNPDSPHHWAYKYFGMEKE